MKKYLKMSDYFITGTFSADYGDVHSVIKYKPSADGLTSRAAHYAVEHAINSHDELVEMNKELIDKLRKASEIMKAAHNSMFEQCLSNSVFNAWGKELNLSAVNELQVGSHIADEAIEMAEGSAA